MKGIILFFLGVTLCYSAINPCDIRSAPTINGSNIPIPTHDDCICYTQLKDSRLTCTESSSYDQKIACWQGENSTVYSGHNIQDLGDYLACIKYPENNYILVSLTDDSGNSLGFVGLCVPVQCQADNLYYIYEFYKITNTTGTIFDYLNKGNPQFIQSNTIPAQQGVPFWTCIIWAATMVVVIVICSLALERINKKENKEEKSANSGSVIRDAGSLLGGDTLSLLNPSVLSYNSSLLEDNSSLKTNKKKQASNLELKKFLEAFDLKRNYEELMQDEPNSEQDENLAVFFGIRVLALLWVIYANVALYAVKYSKNPGGASVFVTQDIWFLVMYAGQYAIDIFFFLSGFLAGFSCIVKARRIKYGLRGYLKFIFHRFIRIWPTYIFVLLFFWGVAQNLGSGPLWFGFVEASQECDSSWWKNFLLIDNLSFAGTDDYCFNWGWYLACDFQLFLIVPLICWAYEKSQENTRNVIWLLIVISIGTSYYNAIYSNSYYDIPPLNLNINGLQDFYYNPFVRASVYLIGLYLGINYKKHRTREEKNIFDALEDNKFAAYVIHLLGALIIGVVVFYPRGLQNDGDAWSLAFQYIWNIFGHIIYILGLFFFIGPVLAGHLTFWKSVFSCGFFVLFAKLSFVAYLVHYMMILFDFNAVASLTDFDQGNLIYKALAISFFSFVLAALIHLFIEKPITQLEKNFLSPKTKLTLDEDKEALVQAKFSVQDIN